MWRRRADHRGADRRPHPQGEHHGHGGGRSQQQDWAVEAEARRGLSQAGFADRGQRGEHVGEGQGADRAHEGDHQGRCHAEPHQVTSSQPQGLKGRELVALHPAGPAQGLPHDRRPGQGGQRGEQPPADRLGMDGAGHQQRGGAHVNEAREVRERLDVVLEGVDVGGPVAKAYEVVEPCRCLREHGTGEGGCRVDVVDRTGPSLELVDGGLDADYAQRHERPSRRGAVPSGVVDRLRLGGRVHPHPQDGPDVHAVVPLQGEGGQHLVRR